MLFTDDAILVAGQLKLFLHVIKCVGPMSLKYSTECPKSHEVQS
jgi:hypothetical protein